MTQRFKIGDVIAAQDGTRAGTVIGYVGEDVAFTNIRGIKVIADEGQFKLYALPEGSRVDETSGTVTFRPVAELPPNLLYKGSRGWTRSWLRVLVDEFGDSEHTFADFTEACEAWAKEHEIDVLTPDKDGTPRAWGAVMNAVASHNKAFPEQHMIGRRSADNRFYVVKDGGLNL